MGSYFYFEGVLLLTLPWNARDEEECILCEHNVVVLQSRMIEIPFLRAGRLRCILLHYELWYLPLEKSLV